MYACYCGVFYVCVICVNVKFNESAHTARANERTKERVRAIARLIYKYVCKRMKETEMINMEKKNTTYAWLCCFFFIILYISSFLCWTSNSNSKKKEANIEEEKKFK